MQGRYYNNQSGHQTNRSRESRRKIGVGMLIDSSVNYSNEKLENGSSYPGTLESDAQAESKFKLKNIQI